MQVNALRGIETVKLELGQLTETPVDLLFRNFDISKPIELEGISRKIGRRLLRLKVLQQHEELSDVHIWHSADMRGVTTRPVESATELQTSTLSPVGVATSSEIVRVLELEYQTEQRSGKYYLILDKMGMQIEPLPPPYLAIFPPARG